MISNINHLPLRTFTSIESYWKQGNIYGFKTPHYHKLSPAEHKADGWRLVVLPEIDPATHKFGGLIYTYDPEEDEPELDVVTREKIVLTQAEQDQYQENLLHGDQSAQTRQQEASDGQVLFERFLTYIQREYDQNRLTGQQALAAFNMLYIPLLPLKDGMFRIVQANLNAITPPGNQALLAVLNKAKAQVEGYLNG